MGMMFGRKGVFGRIGISRFLQWRLNTYLMWMLPFSWMQTYIGLLGKIFFYFNRKERHIIRRNIRLIVGDFRNDQPIERVIQRTFKGIFTHYAEKLFIAYTNLGRAFKFLRKNVVVEGRELLDDALAQGKGVIFVTGHYGAVEFLPTVLGLEGYALTMLLRFKTKDLKRSLNNRIKSAGDVKITLVDVTESRNVMFEAMKALKSNQIVITECDEFEEWRPCQRRRNRFLGRNVPFDRTLDMLQKRSKSPAVMGIVQRRPGGRFVLKLHSLIREGSRRKEDVSLPQKALTTLERYITEAPYQWYQWKDASYILQSEIAEMTGPVPATEEVPVVPLEDTPVHAF